jgi:hypothetical protein
MGWTYSKYVRLFSISILSLALTNCGNSDFFFGLSPEDDYFEQSSTLNRINTIDVLWVMDNSGSMSNLQTNISNNMNNFMSSFLTEGYDFQMAVVGTDAWKAEYGFSPDLAKFKDGSDATSHTGVFVVNPTTINPIQTFMTNIMIGITGSGDERAFQSMRAGLDSSLNPGFVRSGGYLSVIIVSDEEDFSHDDATMNESYSQPTLHPVDSYVTYLDQLTRSTARFRRYNVSTVSITDQACLDQNPGKKKGQRYMDLADATKGLKVSICSPTFADELERLRSYLIEMLTQFYLSRTPVVSTIVVSVSGRIILQDDKNGWTYHSDTNSIRFHGSAVPGEGEQISINYDPESAKL